MLYQTNKFKGVERIMFQTLHERIHFCTSGKQPWKSDFHIQIQQASVGRRI